MNKAKPDCTGQRFGQLTVLGKGARLPRQKTYRQLWKLQCDCGKIIEIPRESFDNNRSNKQISCGCARNRTLKRGRKPIDITGKIFGTLEAIALTGKKDKLNQPTWQLQCDCGNTCELSLKIINGKYKYNSWVNCGDRSKHSEIWLEYPPAPNPYPQEAGNLLIKYLYLTELDYPLIDTAVEDEKRDRLIRAAWILTYRRSLGEEISELHESRYMRKSLLYCSIDVFWKRKLEQQGGFLYTVTGSKKEIGGKMTNATSNDYPKIEFLRGQNLMSASECGLPINAPVKRLKFKRY